MILFMMKISLLRQSTSTSLEALELSLGRLRIWTLSYDDN